MESASVRNFLLKYLHKDGNDALLRFWTAVENLKLSHKVNKYTVPVNATVRHDEIL